MNDSFIKVIIDGKCCEVAIDGLRCECAVTLMQQAAKGGSIKNDDWRNINEALCNAMNCIQAEQYPDYEKDWDDYDRTLQKVAVILDQTKETDGGE